MIKIRYYKNKDFPQLEQLLKDTGIYYQALDKKNILKKKIDYDPESIIVAEDNKKICGTVFIIYDPWAPFIFHLGVHPDYQRKGLGSKLMEKAEGILKERGTIIPTLFVEEENQEVVDFYKKRGWKVLGSTLCMEKEF